MLDALQKIGMRHRPSRQRWATEILRATRGEDLTRLKAYVDDGGVSAAGCQGMRAAAHGSWHLPHVLILLY